MYSVEEMETAGVYNLLKMFGRRRKEGAARIYKGSAKFDCIREAA